MQKNLYTIIFILAVVGLSGSILLKSLLRKKQTTTSKVSNNATTYKVAILTPTTHPALEDIEKGFVQTLNKDLNCSYDTYNANGNRTLMRSQAETIIAKNYDLIFTIATHPALIIKEVAEQRKSNTPIIAGAVDDPVGIKLVESMQSSNNNITAVTGTDSFDEQISLLQYIKPDLQNILLVYNPTSGLEKKKDAIVAICGQKNIPIKPFEVFTINDIFQKIPTIIHQYDTVMILKDNVVVSGIESLVNICNRSHKTLYASDLNSGDKGAALSYGVYEYNDGVESAQKALEILQFNKKPSEIPSSVTKNFNIKLNTKTMSQQGLLINPNLLFLMKSSEVI